MVPERRYGEDDFLRRFFDWLWGLDPKATYRRLRATYRRLDHRTRWLAVMIPALFILVVGGFALGQAAMDYVRWQNRPPLESRLAPPYGLETRALPTLDGTTATTFEAIFPATVGEYALQVEEDITVDTLLSGCLLSTGQRVETACTVTFKAEDAWAGRYLTAEGTWPITVVMAQFATDQMAAQVMLDLYRYARSIGPLGNYALREGQPVNYFYSSTRNGYSFTWSHGPWVYHITSLSFDHLDSFLQAFPY